MGEGARGVFVDFSRDTYCYAYTMTEPQTADAKPVAKLRPWWQRALRRVFVMATCIYVAGCAIPMYFMQDSMMFPTDIPPEPYASPPFKNVERILIDVGLDRPVESWLVWPKPRDAGTPDATEKFPVVFYFHGNGEIIDQEDEPVHQYNRLGWAVLLVEFRGYGRSPGKPGQAAFLADNLKLYDTIAARRDIDTSRILFHGRSLGGGVAADLASMRKPRAMILESTFCSMARRADGFFLPRALVKHQFRNDEVMPKLGVPTFCSHGTRDEVIPFAEGKELAGMIPNAEFFEMDCGHNDKFSSKSYKPFWEKVEGFLRANNL